MNKVEVRLFATLREGRFKKQFIEIDENLIIKDILEMFKINKEDVAIILLNGIDGDCNRTLKSGDVLSIFPPVGGG